MPILTNEKEPTRILEWSCNTFVGRRLIGGLAFDGDSDVDREVSSVHAALTWNRRANAWQVHDLASANGTFVGRERVTPGVPYLLTPEARIVFGRSAWILSDSEPPPAAATCGSQRRVLAVDGVMLLPDEMHPELVVYRGDRKWHVKPWSEADDADADADRPLAHGDTITTGKLEWTIALPSDTDTGTAQRTYMRRGLLAGYRLRIEVSRNMEDFRLILGRDHEVRTLPSRRHHELLWLLARARLEDRSSGVAADEEGWRSPDELLQQMGAGRGDTFLNVLVHRTRKQLEKAGFSDYEDIIERRSKPKAELRIGVREVEVAELS